MNSYHLSLPVCPLDGNGKISSTTNWGYWLCLHLSPCNKISNKKLNHTLVTLFNKFFNYPNKLLALKKEKKEVIEAEPVRKPFEDKSSAETRKFPAAALTSISILPKCLNVDSTTLAASSCFRTSPSNPTAYTHNRIHISNSLHKKK